MKFLDLVKVYIKSGNGGSGALSFRRENILKKEGQMVAMVEEGDQFGEFLTSV